MAESSKRRFRIFQDEIKLRHTTHWDLDTMSRAELEAYMQGPAELRTNTEPMIPAAPAADAEVAVTEKSAWSRFLRACLPGR